MRWIERYIKFAKEKINDQLPFPEGNYPAHIVIENGSIDTVSIHDGDRFFYLKRQDKNTYTIVIYPSKSEEFLFSFSSNYGVVECLPGVRTRDTDIAKLEMDGYSVKRAEIRRGEWFVTVERVRCPQYRVTVGLEDGKIYAFDLYRAFGGIEAKFHACPVLGTVLTFFSSFEEDDKTKLEAKRVWMEAKVGISVEVSSEAVGA